MVVVLVGVAVVIAAFASPWWTRGFTVDTDAEEDSFFIFPGAEGAYLEYGPFSTPGSERGFSTDSGRATAVAVLGIAAVIATLFMGAHVVLRSMGALGRVKVDRNVPVRLAMAAALVGTFTILWAGLFLPLAGPNPGFLWGEEESAQGAFASEYSSIKVTRYANAGFFFGMVAFVALPAYLWVDSSAARARVEDPSQEAKAAPRDAVSF